MTEKTLTKEKKNTTEKASVKKTVKKTAKPEAVDNSDKEVAQASSAKKTNLTAKIYDSKGNAKGSIKLPESVFGARFNADLVHQVVTSIQANARITYAHTKDRSEVRGGGKKPWRQKGTGRARHGSNRSPIWAGGGVTFGPRKDKDYTKKTTKKMRVKALYSILSQKLKDGELIFIDDIKTSEPKTKNAKSILYSLAKIKGNERITEEKKNVAMVLLSEHDINTAKSFRNLKGIYVEEVRNMNPLNLLTYKYIVITRPEEAAKFLESKVKSEKAKVMKETK